jgi:UDP-2,3-diacylglucosamine pyrophosphatase LpxH
MKIYLKKLEKIFNECPEININDDQKIVIFSDLHIGNGSVNDDFLKNGKDFEYILRNYYYNRDYKLILNGDIEELYKFKYNNIHENWKELYCLFDLFERSERLFRIQGNHDYNLYKVQHDFKLAFEILPALKLKYKDEHIFIFHGHQTSDFLETYNRFSQFFIRYFSRYLFIKNTTVPFDNMKKFITEVRSYEFSIRNKIISILGHTHRALFESLSKKDDLLIKIETLLRKYSKVLPEKQLKIEFLIKKYRDEIEHIHKENKENNLKSGIYNEKILVPCLFNSGDVIGKHGFTGIEINKGKISLIYWFDKNKSQRYIDYKGVKLKNLPETDYYRAKIKEESLDYIFTRIKLLC